MSNLFWLTDAQMARLRPFFPKSHGPKLKAENEEIADPLVGLTDARKTWGFGLCFLHLRNVKGHPIMRIEQVLATGMFRDPRWSVTTQGESLRLTAVIVTLACSDGMSNRSYGLDVTVIIEGRGQLQMLTGCCSIAPR